MNQGTAGVSPRNSAGESFRGRVFVSHVHENTADVDRLKLELSTQGIPVWENRHHIVPGLRWRPAIVQAIRDGAYFIACFSVESCARPGNGMDDELDVAIEELASRPQDRAWFIPVILSPCQVPKRPLGNGTTLDALQVVDLHADWRTGIGQILRTIWTGGTGAPPDPTGAPARSSSAPRPGMASIRAEEELIAEGNLTVSHEQGAGAPADADGAVVNAKRIKARDITVSSRRM